MECRWFSVIETSRDPWQHQVSTKPAPWVLQLLRRGRIRPSEPWRRRRWAAPWTGWSSTATDRRGWVLHCQDAQPFHEYLPGLCLSVASGPIPRCYAHTPAYWSHSLLASLWRACSAWWDLQDGFGQRVWEPLHKFTRRSSSCSVGSCLYLQICGGLLWALQLESGCRTSAARAGGTWTSSMAPGVEEARAEPEHGHAPLWLCIYTVWGGSTSPPRIDPSRAETTICCDVGALLCPLEGEVGVVISIFITVGQYSLPCIMLDKFVIYYASPFAFNQGTLCGFPVSPEKQSFYHLSITKPLISFLMFSWLCLFGW